MFSHAEKWLGEFYHPAILDLDLDSEGEIYRKNATNFPVKARFSHVNVPFNFHFMSTQPHRGSARRTGSGVGGESGLERPVVLN